MNLDCTPGSPAAPRYFQSVQPALPNLAQGRLDQLVLNVISRATNCCDQRPSLRYQPLPASVHKDSEGSEEGNSQGLGATSPSQIVEYGSIAGVGETESYHGRLSSSQVPFADFVRNRNVGDDREPGMRRDGSRQPILALFGRKLLEDSLGNDDPLGERRKKIEARNPAQQNQR